MKKLLTLFVALVLCVGAFVGCNGDQNVEADLEEIPAYEKLDNTAYTLTDTEKSSVKVGLICLHDTSSTYDKNFIDSMYQALSDLGLSKSTNLLLATGIAETGDACYNKAKEFIEAGCTVVFADSFGHEADMIRIAREYENVQVCHATGVKAHTENLPNYHNAFASIYEGRYLAGIAAGMKLNEMIEAKEFEAKDAKVGYVGAYPYAEVKSGYSAFFLGVRSVCPTATMEVSFTNSWYNPQREKTEAERLIASGCKLISQHADSMGAPSACETKGVPNVSYNGSTAEECPSTFIVSSRIDWTPYFKLMINNTVKGVKEGWTDYTGTLATGSVKLTAVNKTAAAKGTIEAIVAARTRLGNGELKVFDTSKFTVNGKKVEEYLADVDDAGDFKGETQVIKTEDGKSYFAESEFRSAPYFDLTIDGITLLTTDYQAE